MQIGKNNHKQVPTLKFGLYAVYNHENGNYIICKMTVPAGHTPPGQTGQSTHRPQVFAAICAYLQMPFFLQSTHSNAFQKPI